MACPVNLEAGWIDHGPKRQILAAEMRCGAPRRLVLALVAGDPRHDVDAPTEIGTVRRMVWTARELFPLAGLGIVDLVRSGQAAEEIESEPSPGLRRIEVAERILALDFLAFEELGHDLDLLPGLRHAPFALVACVLPGLGQIGVGEIVGPVIEVVAVTIDRDPIRLVVPGSDRRL